jgi:hypothetical protein
VKQAAGQSPPGGVYGHGASTSEVSA